MTRRSPLNNSKEKADAVPIDDDNCNATDKQVRAFVIRTGLHDIDIEPKDFWSQAEQQGECWVWVGEMFDNGYGKLRRYSRSEPDKRVALAAHRYSYYLAYGYDAGELFVCHFCDQRSCLRPDHLFLGTNLSNQHDISRKRRQISGEMDMPPDLRAIAAMLHDPNAPQDPFADCPDAFIWQRGIHQFMVQMKMHGARFARTFGTIEEARAWRTMIHRLLTADAVGPRRIRNQRRGAVVIRTADG